VFCLRAYLKHALSNFSSNVAVHFKIFTIDNKVSDEGEWDQVWLIVLVKIHKYEPALFYVIIVGIILVNFLLNCPFKIRVWSILSL